MENSCDICFRIGNTKRVGVGTPIYVNMCRYCASKFKYSAYTEFRDWGLKCLNKKKQILRDNKLTELGI